jgi:hypothetical protein
VQEGFGQKDNSRARAESAAIERPGASVLAVAG